MKTQKFKRTVSLLLAMLMCVTTLFGMGTTAFAAEETDEVYLISYIAVQHNAAVYGYAIY